MRLIFKTKFNAYDFRRNQEDQVINQFCPEIHKLKVEKGAFTIYLCLSKINYAHWSYDARNSIQYDGWEKHEKACTNKWVKRSSGK